VTLLTGLPHAPSIPLFNPPSVLAFRTQLVGPRNDPTIQGPTWNIEEWHLTGRPR
jgi:hypothetical protein